MGKQINLINCINPQHADSTPSMAVYDHGGAKLQVYCFGCHYHAWVNPTDIELINIKKENSKRVDVAVESADHTNLVAQFFLDRNFEEDRIPWGRLRMGDENWRWIDGETYIDKAIKLKPRPYMEWDLYDESFNVRGVQRRYLDDGKPKTRYYPDKGGNYADVAWTSIGYSALHITESWIDAQWVTQYRLGQTMTILGTNPNKIKDNIYTWAKEYRIIHLWFDGDTPGIRCANQIMYWCGFHDVKCVNHTKEGKKVYEL